MNKRIIIHSIFNTRPTYNQVEQIIIDKYNLEIVFLDGKTKVIGLDQISRIEIEVENKDD